MKISRFFCFFIAVLLLFYASCVDPKKGNRYTVTFDSMGGSEIASQTVKHGKTASKPNDPANPNAGYGAFKGWRKSLTEPVGNFDFKTPINGDITLYAQYNLTLDRGAIGPGGGKIFYLNPDGFIMDDTGEICHYLEAAPSDFTNTLAWSSSGNIDTDVAGTESYIGAGRKNTALILAADASAPAAKACADIKINGMDDWFLPSRDELYSLFIDLPFSDLQTPVDNRSFAQYWSSSQWLGPPHGDGFQFSSPDGYDRYIGDIFPMKNITLGVRPIRAF